MLKYLLKDLIKPRKIEVEDVTRRYGKFVIAPLERGYGTTIGNSLRRILLSSLPGCAITEVKIDGVKHEFSTIPGVVEDVTEVLLNLKDIVIDLGDKEEATLTIDVKGPCTITAGMIQVPAGTTVINPDHHIGTINDDARFAAELIAKSGRGYLMADDNPEEARPIGTIALDAMFSPVRKVNHVVTNARVGQRTDYDRLTLEIWTDGSISPEEALRGASIVLKDQLSVFVGEEAIIEEAEAPAKQEEGAPKWNENLFRRIDELELSVRSSNCLENADIKYIGELVQRSEHEMLRTKNFGRKSLNEIKDILAEMGLGLGMRLDSFPPREELDRIHDSTVGMLND